MLLERKWDTVPPQAFTADGTSLGLVTIADTAGFYVKQDAYLINNSAPDRIAVQVKRVLSSTQLIVGLVDNKIPSFKPLDISVFTVASGAKIGAELQDKNAVPPDPHYLAIYEAEPIVADRVILVDEYGDKFNKSNPIPTTFDGTIAIGDVSIVEGGNTMTVNPGGSINVNVVSVPTAGNVVVNQYGEANSVVSGATTTVVQYTVPGTLTNAILQRISVSGENIAKWTVFWNGTQIDTRRTFYGNSLSEYFEFTTGSGDGFTLSPGDTIVVYVLHQRPYVGDFEGRIQVLQIA